MSRRTFPLLLALLLSLGLLLACSKPIRPSEKGAPAFGLTDAPKDASPPISELTGVWRAVWNCSDSDACPCESYMIFDGRMVRESVFWCLGKVSGIAMQVGSYAGNPDAISLDFEKTNVLFGKDSYSPDTRRLKLTRGELVGESDDPSHSRATPFKAEPILSRRPAEEWAHTSWRGEMYGLSYVRIEIGDTLEDVTLYPVQGPCAATLHGAIRPMDARAGLPAGLPPGLSQPMVFQGDVSLSAGCGEYAPDSLVFARVAPGFELVGIAQDFRYNVSGSFYAVRTR